MNAVGRLLTRIGWAGLLWGTVAVASPPRAVAQEPTPLPRAGCFRGRPLPECSSFWVVELRGQIPFATSSRLVRDEFDDPSQGTPFEQGFPVEAFKASFGWDVGYAWNVNDRYAFGGSVGLELLNPDTRPFLRARVRRWFGDGGTSLEFAPGVFRARPEGSFSRDPQRYGGSLDLRLNVRDQGFLSARYDWLNLPRDETRFGGQTRIDPGGYQQAIYLGAGLGSVPTLIGSGVLGTGFLIFVAILLGTGYD